MPLRIGVIGCGDGNVVIAMARAAPAAVLAGFDGDPWRSRGPVVLRRGPVSPTV